MTMPDYLTETDTGFIAESYFQHPGKPPRFYKKSHVRAAIRRAGTIVTDEPIGPRQPTTMTVIRPKPAVSETRVCEGCSEPFTAVRRGATWPKYCTVKCQTKANTARYKARRKARAS